MNHRKHQTYYHAETALDHIYETNQQQKSTKVNDNHHCQLEECPLEYFEGTPEPNWKEIIKTRKLERYQHIPWKHHVQKRSNSIRSSMNFMSDLIKDWSTRVWVISEYSIAKKKNNMKYWFIQLSGFNYKEVQNDLVFFSFDFKDNAFVTTIQQALTDGDYNRFIHTRNDPVYLTFHRMMITQLHHQSFFEMMLKSKASKNGNRLLLLLYVFL
jgi:hypothetical protein